ncbi:hypothetical protein [Mucilaginibacter gilvus]|uniref:Uncharacterized protein n=1 Tax=Mucilaginibacter gilvus TaxID=2305909 RepID=A0A3S3VIR7_9SPHI|nr:hypothetical protein [Mucilaginibacter gilvus]RWY54334.1 hypothetical protein EPL05_09875 [Mucilaginibacter gilvus]
MIQVKKEGIISDLVLNSATVKVNDTVYLFYRAVEKGNFSSIGFANLGARSASRNYHGKYYKPDYRCK